MNKNGNYFEITKNNDFFLKINVLINLQTLMFKYDVKFINFTTNLFRAKSPDTQFTKKLCSVNL